MKISRKLLQKIIAEQMLQEKNKGLWANIHAKKKRGEKSDPRTKSYQDAKKAGQKLNKEIDEADEAHDPSYKAPSGSKRAKQLDATQADLASGDPKREKRAWARRERMERQHNEKNESFRRKLQSIIYEELSKSTEDKIRKTAEERGMTFGSMKAEYKKGLAAWGSSGSKPGMSQHAWAQARINKANPSDDWSVVKKSKAKKEIDEADDAAFTDAYDDDPALKGDQKDLPDNLQKGIIDKANEGIQLRRKLASIVRKSDLREVASPGIFESDYFYDLLAEEVNRFLSDRGDDHAAVGLVKQGQGLTRTEIDSLRMAIMVALNNIEEDYGQK